MENSFPAIGPSASGFRFQRLLGSGASAQVWLVLGEDGVERALKCFPGPRLASAQGSARGSTGELRREIRISANFSHEHLLAVHDVVKLTGAWLGGTGLLVDYAAGGSLAGVLAARRRISPGELVTVLVPMFQVLAFLHRRGVAHGDVSAANVLFSEVGKPLLADLGTARMAGDSQDGCFGTEGFMDPSLLLQDQPGAVGAADAAADVYAMSALGWWCLSGELPGAGRERGLASAHVVTTRWATTTLADSAEAKLFALLAAGMEPDRRRRPAACDVAQELLRVVAAEPLDLMPSVHPSVLPRLLTRRQLRGTSQDSAFGSAKSRRHKNFRPWVHKALAIKTPAIKAPVINASAVPSRGRRRQTRGVPPAPIGPGFRRAWRPGTGRAMAATVLLGGLGLSVAALQPGFSAAQPPQTSASPALPRVLPGETSRSALFSDDPTQAIPELSRLRAEAFRTADAGLLSAVNAAGSPAEDQDRQTMAELTARKRVLAGFSAAVRHANVIPDFNATVPDGGSVIAATIELSPYQEQDAGGVVFSRQPESRRQVLTFQLLNRSGRWFIAEVLSAQ